MADQTYRYKFVFDYGPGHQSHYECEMVFLREFSRNELRDEWEQIVDQMGWRGATGTAFLVDDRKECPE
jgi:hypothetical protein